MPVRVTPQISVLIDYPCDACGCLVELDKAYTGARYRHTCPQCQTDYYLPQPYPSRGYANLLDWLADCQAILRGHNDAQ